MELGVFTLSSVWILYFSSVEFDVFVLFFISLLSLQLLLVPTTQIRMRIFHEIVGKVTLLNAKSCPAVVPCDFLIFSQITISGYQFIQISSLSMVSSIWLFMYVFFLALRDWSKFRFYVFKQQLEIQLLVEITAIFWVIWLEFFYCIWNL